MEIKKKSALFNGSFVSNILKIIWIGLSVFFVFIGCGYIFYLKIFYPFHMLIIFSILFVLPTYYALVFFLPHKSKAKILSFLVISIVLMSSGYGGFATSRFNDNNQIVPNPQARDGNFLEHVFKSSTFPLYEFLLQKMSNIKLKDIKFHVSQPHIQQIRSMLEPGDIILLRKNNYVSNWIIKGFWKHAAIYCGSLDEMEDYFAAESKTVLGSTIKDYLFQQIRPSYDEFVRMAQFQDGAVIESTSQGVNLRTMDKALLSDHLAVLRPRLPKKNKLSAILYSLDQLKKPYDYYLDFMNDDAFCCSELIYNAFYPHDGTGLNYDLYMVNGCPLISPNDFVKDFDQTYSSADCQYDFIQYVSKDIEPDDSLEKKISLFRVSWKKKVGI